MTVFGGALGAIAAAMLALAGYDLWRYLTGRTKSWRSAQQLTKDLYLFALFVASAQTTDAISRNVAFEALHYASRNFGSAKTSRPSGRWMKRLEKYPQFGFPKAYGLKSRTSKRSRFPLTWSSFLETTGWCWRR